MEYVPEYLLEIWKSDMAEGSELLFKISDEINKYTNDAFLSCDKYAEIIHKLNWPDDEEKQAFENADRNAKKMIPTLLRGVVVDNYIVEGSDMRCLQLVDINSFNGKETTDAETLLHLQETKNVQYSLFAYRYKKDFSHSIGPLEKVAPGTKVILSLIDIKPAPNNPRRWVTAYFTDIIADNSPLALYIDAEYKIHTTRDYLESYVNLRNSIQKSPSGNTSRPVQKKRESKLDQRYTQYKAELEGLVATEGGYDEIQQRYQEAVRQYDALKQSYDTFLTGLSSSADAQIQKSSQNLADKGKARFITGLIIAGALFLFLFAPLGICLLAVGIVWAVIYTRNQKSSAQNLAQSYPEFQKIQQDFKEAEQKMMYYKELTEKIKMVEN